LLYAAVAGHLSQSKAGEGIMNKHLWVVAVCPAIGAAVGVAIAESIVSAYAIKLIIVAAGGGMGAAIGTRLATR
jgi:hypothetical protein